MRLNIAIRLWLRCFLPLFMVGDEYGVLSQSFGSTYSANETEFPTLDVAEQQPHSAKKSRPRSSTPTPASNKKSKPTKAVLLQSKKVTELRNCIAAMIYSRLKTGNQDMAKCAQYDYMFEKFHGFKHPKSGTQDRSAKIPYATVAANIANSSIVPAYIQFLEGKDCYDVFWDSSDDLEGEGTVLTLRPDITNDQYTSVIANRNLTAAQLATTTAKCDYLITGRSLHEAAQSVIKESKKFLSLMPLAINAKIIEKVGAEEDNDDNQAQSANAKTKQMVSMYGFPSGKKLADFQQFLLFEMNNWDLFYGACVQAADKAETEEEPSEEKESDEEDTREDDEDENLGINDYEADLINSNNIALPEAPDGDIYSVHVDNGTPPPLSFNPRGYMVFMAWGPLGVTLSSLGKQLKVLFQSDNDGGSRKEARKERALEKAKERDEEAGIGDVRRGMALGAESHKEVAIMAQRQAQLSQAQRDSEILRLTKLIDSQNVTLQTYMSNCKFLNEIGQIEKRDAAMEKYDKLSAEVETNQMRLKHLENTITETPDEVKHFLNLSRKSMGLPSNDQVSHEGKDDEEKTE